MNYRKELREAEEKLMELDQQKLAIEHQMRGWVQIIEGLRVLADKDASREHSAQLEQAAETDTPSFANCVRNVLIQTSAPIGATQIRDQLVEAETVESSKNLLINVHTTVKRLIKSGEVEEVPLQDGSKLYRFVTPMERAIKAPYGAPNSLANTILHESKNDPKNSKWIKPKDKRTKTH
jgi:hypothetical protein